MAEMKEWKKGDRVRMTEKCKQNMMAPCGPSGEHLGPFDPGDGDQDPGGDCWGCSREHIEEFGDCVGVVDGPVFEQGIGVEMDVYWEPSGLRYGYHPNDLEAVNDRDG